MKADCNNLDRFFGCTLLRVAFFGAVVAVSGGIRAGEPTAWPLLTMRHMSPTSRSPETMAELIRIHARHPGGCDEMWLADSAAFLTAESNVVARARALASYRPELDAAGIVAGFQQGFTLGHGPSLGFGRGKEIGLAETAGQVDAQGRRMGLLCPNSPEVLAEEERFAENIVREGRFESFWLDDDLRFGFKNFGACCWCDRCLKLLNERCGTTYTRDQFVARLSSTNETDALRAQWAAFKAESLANFAAAARRGAKKANPNCRMGYQAISSATIAGGEDFKPVLAALSDNFSDSVGIRPGHGYYAETDGVLSLQAKLLDVAREAERCHAIPGWRGQVAYEQENFPHYAAFKSPEAILKECALALAVGCDAVTMYWYDARYPEPLSHYEELVAGAAAWRPYFARLAALVPGTHLGGVARHPDPNLMTGLQNTFPKTVEHAFPRRSRSDGHLALAGIPVTVHESGTRCFYEPKDVTSWGHILDYDRVKLLDRLDAQPGGPVCVRVDKTHRLYAFPRVDDAGRTVAATFFNVSMGEAKALPVRIRRPRGAAVKVVRPCQDEVTIPSTRGTGDEVRIVLPDIPAFSLLTVILEAPDAPDPQEVFENPPQSAKTGVWWHWMGCNVTKEGIVKDLDWFKEVGIGAATIFGMADICTPWATTIENSPTKGLVAFTPQWWQLVRFACEEAEKRGVELGLHNCPGYTSTGGPWVPPRLAMRELVFNVTNVAAQVSLKANAPFPVQVGGKGDVFAAPDIPSRRADLQEIAVVDGVRVQHIPMGSFTQPNQWEAFGLECDKMNPEAVAFHLDHVLGDLKRHVGDQVGRGLKFILLDSYEAGKPSWTPNMRAEFKARRGYDPLPFLPILGGFKVSAAPDVEAEERFKADYERTIKDLYRDVLFKTMHEKLGAVGLEFACEPYTGPFDSRECAAHVDRLMTEFWFNPSLDRGSPEPLGWDLWAGPGGMRHNVVEAEAFTGQPANCQWTETPLLLKAAGDTQFCRGVNRMTLHSCPLQPWGDDVKPGKTMGRWGTHFGRNQTWAESGRGWFAYLNRCQALLQWGEPSSVRIDGLDITPRGTPITMHAREADGKYVFLVVNHSDKPASMNMGLPNVGKAAEWFDPVTGGIAPLAVVNGCAAIQLAPCGSGFLVLRKPAGSLEPNADSAYYQKLAKPFNGGDALPVAGPWRVTFGNNAVEMSTLSDWTANDNPEVKYFSGTAVYRTHFVVDSRLSNVGGSVLSLGNCNGQIAKVVLNGKAFEPVWCEPYEVRLAVGDLKEGENTLEIEFTNVWANRLIGDEQEPPDCKFAKAVFPGGWYLEAFPDWFSKGMAARPSKGRRCFTDWNYFAKDSKLTPSGLLGPVAIRKVVGATFAQADVVDTNGVKWIDGRFLPLEGKCFTDTDRFYDRLPKNVTTNVNSGVRGMKGHTAGMQFRFRTNSSTLDFRWVPLSPVLSSDHFAASGKSGIDVYRQAADGKWRYVNTGRIRDASGGSLHIGWTPGDACLVNLPLSNGVKSFSLGIGKDAKIEALGPRKSGICKPVVFYGTSITHGGCASRPGMAYPSIVGRDLDVPIANLGFSGSGRMELEMSEHLAAIDASCYVLDCLWNMDDDMVRSRYEPFIRNLRAKRPVAPIVMAEQSDVFCRVPNDKDRFVKALYDKLVAEGWKNLVYLPKTNMYAGDCEGTVDGCHPNDWGMMSMGKAFGAAVRDALSMGSR